MTSNSQIINRKIKQNTRIFLFTTILCITNLIHPGHPAIAQTNQTDQTTPESIQLNSTPKEKIWSIITRWDYRTRHNGKYIGLTNREMREIYQKTRELPEGQEIQGNVLLLGDTKRNGKSVASHLEMSREVHFIAKADAETETEQEITPSEPLNQFPMLQNFPYFPNKTLKPGDQWVSELTMLIIGPEGQLAQLQLPASYHYSSDSIYQDRDVHIINVTWAVRQDPEQALLNPELMSASGNHNLRLIMDAQKGTPIFARDLISEQYTWENWGTEKRDGFALIFWDGVPPLDYPVIEEELRSTFRDQDVQITAKPGGISLTLRNLLFQPDSDQLLPGQEQILQELAQSLKDIPERTILVRGHTADIGEPENQSRLSEQRAQVIAIALSNLGIKPERLVFEGVGAREPIAPNTSESGRRQNRRVEILIIED